MDSNNLSLADIASVVGKDDKDGGMFGGNGIWLIAIIILLFLFMGGGFGGNGATAASQSDLQRAVDLNSIQEGQATINTNIQRIGYETMATVKDAAYSNLSEIRDLQMQTNNGFSAMQTCCCETNRNIDSVRFDLSNYAAQINANTTAQTQKVLDAICGNRMADMQNQINQLQIQNAMCGLPRINPYGYNLVPTFDGCGCGGNV